MNKKYDALIFDMDGTTAYTDEMIIHTMLDLYDLYNPKNKKNRDEILYFSGPPLKVTLPKEFPNEPFKKMLDEFLRISKPYYDQYVVPFDNEIEALRKFKNAGYKLAIVTNKGTNMAKYVLSLIGASDLFDYCIGADDVTNMKPHQEGIELALSLLGVDKNKAIYIGDNDIDYLTAKNAGLDSMICNWGPRKLTCLDDTNYVVNSYLEMEKIFL